MGMAEQMKKKAIPATATKVSKKVVKRVDRADIIELNRTLEPIIQQNHKELNDSWETVHNEIVGTK